MMSLEYIQELAQAAAELAAEQNLQPYVPWNTGEVEGWTSFPFPNIGSHEPEGWEKIGILFCGSSGMGAENEPALAATQLKDRVIELMTDNAIDNPGGSIGFAITEVGQFQLYVGVFVRPSQVN